MDLHVKYLSQKVTVLPRYFHAVLPRTTVVSGDLPFTPKAKKVMELAMDEARTLGHNDIGPEHLLLGLIRVGEGITNQIFK